MREVEYCSSQFSFSSVRAHKICWGEVYFGTQGMDTHAQTRTQTPNVIGTELHIPSGVLARMQLFLTGAAAATALTLKHRWSISDISIFHSQPFFFLLFSFAFLLLVTFPFGGMWNIKYKGRGVFPCYPTRHEIILSVFFHLLIFVQV